MILFGEPFQITWLNPDFPYITLPLYLTVQNISTTLDYIGNKGNGFSPAIRGWKFYGNPEVILYKAIAAQTHTRIR